MYRFCSSNIYHKPRNPQKRKKRGIGAQVLLSDNQKSDFVKYHNEVRSSTIPSASDMILMMWDDKLAAKASDYAS